MSKAIKKRKKPRTEVIMGISGVGTWGEGNNYIQDRVRGEMAEIVDHEYAFCAHVRIEEVVRSR